MVIIIKDLEERNEKNEINELWDPEETDLKELKVQTWKTFFKVIGIVCCILILGVGLIIYGTVKLFGTACGNEIISEIPQPEGTYKAIVFIRDCGSTTRQSNQVSIIRNGRNLNDSDTGNVFVTYEPLSLQWSQKNSLVIDYNGGQVFKQKKTFKGISINYE